MNLQTYLDKSYQTFVEQAQKARLILLHPDSRYRSMLVAQLINSDDYDVYYYAMGPDDINLQAFLTSITNSLANQHVMFGRHINLLSPAKLENPLTHLDDVLDTFVQDLAELSKRKFLLILDEYDRSDRSDEVQRFVERLSDRMPRNGRIVINSRTLPRLPWVSMIAQGRAVLLKDGEMVQDEFYSIENRPKNTDVLEVYALGPSFVMVDSEPVDNWEGHLPRLLFFFALDRPIVTRSEICQAFWPDLDPDQAVNVFHVTKRRLHKALEADVLVHEDGYYRINPDLPIYYDVMDFVDVLLQARLTDDDDKKLEYWQRAIDLYRGPFLQGHDERWIVERRVEFRDGYVEALSGTASIMNALGRKEVALSLLQKALSANPLHQPVHREVMTLYAELGRRSEIASHYQQLSEALAESRQQLEHATQEHYQALMS
ncbi:MAG: AfsR/SARP family transcriptional regulator [Chloroflexota bacterium]